MNTLISKYVFFEYLSGRSNPLETKRVEDWISISNNSEKYYQWLFEWECTSPQFIADENQAFEKLISKVVADEFHNIDIPVFEKENSYFKRDIFYSYWWKVAIAVVLLVGVSWVNRDLLYFKKYQTAYGKITTIYLEDGSRVVLNSNSILKVPRFGFWGNTRKVELSGEAEFSVSHTIDDKQFIVKTSDSFQVEVLGTEFSVFARPRSTQVELKTGSVRIDYLQNSKEKKVLMHPGDVATLNDVGAVQLRKQLDTKAFAPWKEQRYIFNSTSVREIGQMMQENFGVKLKSNEEILNRKITGNFKTENVNELLKTLTEVLDLQTLYIDSTTVFISN